MTSRGSPARPGAKEATVRAEDRALCNALWALGRTLGEVLDPSLRRLEVTKGQFFLLWRIARGGPATFGTLADEFGVRPPRITEMVNELEEDGLVRRERTKKDRRLVYLKPTARGARMVAKVDSLVALNFARASISISTAKKAEVARMLSEIAMSMARSTRVD